MIPLVVFEHFIQSTRDTGYRDLSFAVAELIDNALDASATEIDVTVQEVMTGRVREITIGVLDNGEGMEATTLSEALRFGGSERFGGRAHCGRYGMGLPNSSVSQARRVDVYSWRNGAHPLHTFLDVDEIAASRQRGIPQPRRAAMPMWARASSPSGTLVQWSRCDRLQFKKATTVTEKIRAPLGRIFRAAIARGLNLRLNGQPVAPVDPLFRTPVYGLLGTCELYGRTIEYRLKTPFAGESTVAVRFVELPVARWHDVPVETKRSLGIIGGAGMSVLRAGREIDYGWHLFGGKRRENYDDWWRCELSFEPPLDEYFGITHSKQGINPSMELRTALEPDLERIARDLNGRVRAAFRRAKVNPERPAARLASKRDHLLPEITSAESVARRHGTAGYQYEVRLHRDPSPEFFTMDVRDSRVTVSLNENHPFHERMYSQHAPRYGSDNIDLVIISAARALAGVSPEIRRTLVRQWSDNLAAFLD